MEVKPKKSAYGKNGIANVKKTMARVDPRRRAPGRLRKNGQACAHSQRDDQLSQQRLNKPSGSKQRRRYCEESYQHGERQEIED